jgi:hypothetical protein
MNELWNRFGRWVVPTGNRYAVAICVLGFISVILSFPWLGTVLQDSSPLLYLYSALIGGNITLVTIVVSINQLVLSRDFDPPSVLRSEIRETAAYRREATAQPSVPTEPSAFLLRAIQQLHQHALILRGIEAPNNSQLHDEIDRLVTTLTNHSNRVIERLSGGSSELSDVVLAIVRTRYVDRMQDVQRIQSVYRGDLSEEENDELDETIIYLEHLDIARHYFLTIFIQRELSKLSRVLLYTGIPAVAISMAMLVHLTGFRQPPSATIVMFGLVVGTGTVGLLPLSLLASFVARIALVAQYVSITPFEMP